jgi:hypothetical protein
MSIVVLQGGEQRLDEFRKIVQAPSLSKTGAVLDFSGFRSGHVSFLNTCGACPLNDPKCRPFSGDLKDCLFISMLLCISIEHVGELAGIRYTTSQQLEHFILAHEHL